MTIAGRIGGLSAAIVAALALALGAGPSGTAGQPRPNIVVIQTDDQDLASMRVMANVRRLLAAQGTTFDNSFASYPLCCPSRATFLTGQYAHNHGVLHNDPPLGGFKKLDSSNTLPVWLRRAGYRTIHVGKYLNGYDSDDGVPPGWSDWNGAVGISGYRYYDTKLNRNGRLVSIAGRYQTDVFAELASGAIRRHARSPQPFFLYVAFLAPHDGKDEGSQGIGGNWLPTAAPRHRGRHRSTPLPSPPSLNEADVSDKPASIRNNPILTAEQRQSATQNYRTRLESLLAVDEAAARIVAALRASGELGRTLIIFTSDNGYMQGEHRIQEGKNVMYEESIRVPLVLRGPGVPRGIHRRQLVANIDLAPTVLQAARARPGRRIDGRSLLPLASSPSLLSGRDILLQSEVGNAARQYVAVRTPRYVYAEYRSGERELYDLRGDRHQLRSRHADRSYSSVRAALARRLAALRNCRGAACSSPGASRLR